jgi:hypothetical protein
MTYTTATHSRYMENYVPVQRELLSPLPGWRHHPEEPHGKNDGRPYQAVVGPVPVPGHTLSVLILYTK